MQLSAANLLVAAQQLAKPAAPRAFAPPSFEAAAKPEATPVPEASEARPGKPSPPGSRIDIKI